jgi:hypothetical protein
MKRCFALAGVLIGCFVVFMFAIRFLPRDPVIFDFAPLVFIGAVYIIGNAVERRFFKRK